VIEPDGSVGGERVGRRARGSDRAYPGQGGDYFGRGDGHAAGPRRNQFEGVVGGAVDAGVVIACE